MTETNYPDLTTAERANPATHYLLHGKVRCYKTEKHYGFLTTVDGFKLYFRREVVEGNIVSLTSGREIEFSVRLGHKGPEAATVRVAWEHAPSGGGPAQLAELDATTAPYLFATSSTQGFAPHGIATRDASFTHPGTIKPPH